MAFLRASHFEDHVFQVNGKTVFLRMPQASDHAEWAELRSRSRQHLVPWEPAWTIEDLSRMMFRRRLRLYARDVREDLAYPYFLFDSRSGRLIGGLTLSNVRRGASQSAALGYWMGAAFAGQGCMTEAVATVVPFAFKTLLLHRIEAATMPSNRASMRVLEKCGFAREGLARDYLKINGRWEDHVLYGRTDAASSGQSAGGAG